MVKKWSGGANGKGLRRTEIDFPTLISGRFVKRQNRFLVRVAINGNEAGVHLANSGQLADLLQPGREVWVSRAKGVKRKTAFDLRLVRIGSELVSVDARLPGKLLAEAWVAGRVTGLPYERLQTEVQYRDSRLDLRMDGLEGTCWLETKSVTLVEGGCALFPDVPTTRGQKHLRTLIDAREEDYQAGVIFVVQRTDADRLRPHREADPAFAALLEKAAGAGVALRAFNCQVDTSKILLAGEIPVILD